MRSWKMAVAFAFAFETSETFAFLFKCVDMHLLTSLMGISECRWMGQGKVKLTTGESVFFQGEKTTYTDTEWQ